MQSESVKQGMGKLCQKIWHIMDVKTAPKNKNYCIQKNSMHHQARIKNLRLE